MKKYVRIMLIVSQNFQKFSIFYICTYNFQKMYLCISAKLYELACFFIEVQRLNFWNVIIITVFSRLSTPLYILYYNITHYEFIACRLDVLFFSPFFIFNKLPWWFASLIQAVLYLDIGRSRALKLFKFLLWHFSFKT